MLSTIGPFKIDRELGRGGMGVVFLATDSRLDRQVAIKALPADLAADPDRLARFQREAKVLASLNHPNIAAIHGLEEADGHRYLVLEYIEGETLADRLKRGTIPIDEALPIARQIALALEAAHEKSIIHRDLKPGNVMVTPEGAAKVLDFGLARTAEGTPTSSGFKPALDNSPTVTSPAPVHSPTIPGVIMGTAGYMSPEQARGKPVDKRSDIFSFGCVLYELLTGDQPFPGESVTDSLGAILHREPDWKRLPASTPPVVRLLLRRCLAKDRAHRLHDIADARIEIEQAIADPASSDLGLARSIETNAPRQSVARFALPAIALCGVLLAAGAWLWASRQTPAQPARVVRFDFDPPAGFALPMLGEGFPDLCISPDGGSVVFGARSEDKSQLFIRPLNAPESKPIPGTEGADCPFFSPDGRWLGYFADGRMMKMPIAGGPALTICEVTRSPCVWLPDGTIVFGGAGVMKVNEAGGEITTIAEAGTNVKTAGGEHFVLGFNRIEAVPGASYVLGSVWDGDNLETYSVVAVSLKDGSVRSVLRKAGDARFLAPDRLVFLRGSSVMAAPFDPARGVVTGEASVVIDGVRSTRWADAGYLATSPGGTLAYVPGGRMGPGRRLVKVDPSGKATPLMDGVDAFVGGIRVSPDGRDVSALTLRQRIELWTFNLERRSLSLVSTEGETWSPVWAPQADAFFHLRSVPGRGFDVVRRPARGGPAELIPIAKSPTHDYYPSDVSADGSTLLLTAQPHRPGLSEDIALIRLTAASEGPPELLVAGPASENVGRFSPDGKHFVYMSDESGHNEVYVRALTGDAKRVQVSAAGGLYPCWARDGASIFYFDQKRVMHCAPVERGPAGELLRVSTPRVLFDTKGVATTAVWGGFDAFPDGSLAMVAPAPWELQPARVRVVLNWREELVN